jgi:hypothetical protein
LYFILASKGCNREKKIENKKKKEKKEKEKL